jgi:hypothetical protein
MAQYEYRVVPAPAKGEKAKGVKTPQARFALALESLMNQMAAEGWEYLRADMLPSEERQGLTGSTTNWRNVLVFRREIAAEAATVEPKPVAPPEPESATDGARREPLPPLRPATGAERMLRDDGVEEISPVSGMTSALRARAAAQAAQKS